jgi:hypothetical protein
MNAHKVGYPGQPVVNSVSQMNYSIPAMNYLIG